MYPRSRESGSGYVEDRRLELEKRLDDRHEIRQKAPEMHHPVAHLYDRGPKPKPTLLTNHSPNTRAGIEARELAVTSRATARTGSWPYTPSSFAKSFPDPIGTTPSAASVALRRKQAIGHFVDGASPPTAIT